MNRISTANAYGSVLTSLMNLESAQTKVEGQISSQKQGDDLKTYARNAQTLTAAQAVATRVQGYIDQSTALSSKLDAQDQALGQVYTAAQGARTAVANAIAAGGGQGLMQQLQSMLDEAGQGLNAQYNGAYLFAGGQMNAAPLSSTDLATVAAASNPATLFKNDTLAHTERLDDHTTIQTGILASDVGTPLMNTLKAIKTYADANGGLSGNLSTADMSFLQTQLTALDGDSQGITNIQAINGLNQQRVQDNVTAQTNRQDSLKGLMVDISGVDMAQAASNLSQIQTSLQASAQIFTSLRDYSLLNFLQSS